MFVFPTQEEGYKKKASTASYFVIIFSLNGLVKSVVVK
jgi:hypothetical protein